MLIEMNGKLYFNQNWYGETSQKCMQFHYLKVKISDKNSRFCTNSQ